MLQLEYKYRLSLTGKQDQPADYSQEQVANQNKTNKLKKKNKPIQLEQKMLDDDVMTDEEEMNDSKRKLLGDLKKSIENFIGAKRKLKVMSK